jgi:hypothetical protein
LLLFLLWSYPFVTAPSAVAVVVAIIIICGLITTIVLVVVVMTTIVCNLIATVVLSEIMILNIRMKNKPAIKIRWLIYLRDMIGKLKFLGDTMAATAATLNFFRNRQNQSFWRETRSTEAERAWGMLGPHMRTCATLGPHMRTCATLGPHMRTCATLGPHMRTCATLGPHMRTCAKNSTNQKPIVPSLERSLLNRLCFVAKTDIIIMA